MLETASGSYRMVAPGGAGPGASPHGGASPAKAEPPAPAPKPQEQPAPPPQAKPPPAQPKTPLPKAGKKRHAPEFTCPSCGFTQSVNDFRCPRCAVIFHLFLAKRRETRKRGGRLDPYVRVFEQVFIRDGWWKVILVVLALFACFALALTAIRDRARRPAGASLPYSPASAAMAAPADHRLDILGWGARGEPTPSCERVAQSPADPRAC